MKNTRQVFFVSDGTGLTAEAYGRSLLAQFPDFDFESRRLPFIDSQESAQSVVQKIQQTVERSGNQPILFCTLVDSDVQDMIATSNACVIDLFQTFIGPLESALGSKSAHTRGISHKVIGKQAYQDRLNAIDYALQHDDGVRPDHYSDAELILTGVSRCGKTPTSLYIAMNFYISTANYPIVEDELDSETLPALLKPWKSKLIGLTIDPKQLSSIREQRRPGSEYASIEACQREVKAAMSIFMHENVPVFDMTNTSIEEIASWILKEKGLIQLAGR